MSQVIEGTQANIVNRPQAEAEQPATAGLSHFPFLLNVKVDIPYNALCSGSAPSQIAVMWDKSHQQIRVPGSDEQSNYFLKYSAALYHPESLLPVIINDYLLITFAQQELGFPVPFHALVKIPMLEGCQLLMKKLDNNSGSELSAQDIAKAGLKHKTATTMSWEQYCIAVKKHLLTNERMMFLQYLFYQAIIGCELHPNNFVLRTQNHITYLVPFYEMVSKGVVHPDSQQQEVSLIGTQTQDITPQDFWRWAALFKVPRRQFKKVAAQILFQWSYALPDYMDKLQPLSTLLIENLILAPGFSPLSHSVNLVSRLRQPHRFRMRLLERLGWYQYLGIPAPSDGYPVRQMELFDKQVLANRENFPRQKPISRQQSIPSKNQNDARKNQLSLFN